MDGGNLYSIGELAQRTGLTVKTIRFYSDRGIVTPADRSHAGYRRYTPETVARLAFVRTLRELGLGLDVIRRVVDQELTLGEVAAEHASALDVQIRILRLRRAVLTAAARREPTPKEMELMHQLATLSQAERRHLIDDFLDTVFDGPPNGSPLAAARRSMTPELPDNPTDEQVADQRLAATGTPRSADRLVRHSTAPTGGRVRQRHRPGQTVPRVKTTQLQNSAHRGRSTFVASSR